MPRRSTAHRRRAAIAVGVHARAGEAVMVVRDNGIGVPAELRPKIFDLFVQGERTLDRAGGGLGIGLCVVQRLVEVHGGRIGLLSEGPGRGATFEIVLPQAQTRPLDPGEKTPRGPAPMRVLVVDDNEDAAISVAMVLGLDGHAVETVFHPTQALEVATRFRPDVALLDLGLPEMDGYELARRLLALPGLSGLHLIALSGHGQAEDKRRAGDAGFAQHLVKPADMDALYAALAVARDGRAPGRASARPSSNA